MSRTIGTRDVYDALIHEHRDLEALVWDLEWVAGRGDRATAAELIGELVADLRRHLALEACVHARIGGDDLAGAVVYARATHSALDAKLATLVALSPSDPAWMAHLLALRDLLAEHVRHDEEDLFPAASQLDRATAHDERERTSDAGTVALAG